MRMLFLPTPLIFAKKMQMFVCDFCSCWLMGDCCARCSFLKWEEGEQEKVDEELQTNKDNFEFENHLYRATRLKTRMHTYQMMQTLDNCSKSYLALNETTKC